MLVSPSRSSSVSASHRASSFNSAETGPSSPNSSAECLSPPMPHLSQSLVPSHNDSQTSPNSSERLEHSKVLSRISGGIENSPHLSVSDENSFISPIKNSPQDTEYSEDPGFSGHGGGTIIGTSEGSPLVTSPHGEVADTSKNSARSPHMSEESLPGADVASLNAANPQAKAQDTSQQQPTQKQDTADTSKGFSNKDEGYERTGRPSDDPETSEDPSLRKGGNTPPEDPDPRPQNRFKEKESLAAQEWDWQKKRFGVQNKEIEELMGLVGLERVKKQILAINAKVQIFKHQETSLNKERFNVIFQGNPGTGKTTVARIYAKFLKSSGALSSDTIHETSGAKLAYEGPRATRNMIREMIETEGSGVLFVDEAYQLTESHTSDFGRQVLDIILTEMENNIGKLVVIFVGYNKEMESFFEHNPGLASRIPYTIQFDDFEDVELWNILHKGIIEKYGSKMKVEGGMGGLYTRIAIRRLAHGRGVRAFGNARAVNNLLARITERQANRLIKEYREGTISDHFYFTKEDLIGPNPSEAKFKSTAWARLKELVGLEKVKESASSMIDMIETNYLRELEEKNPLEFSLNRVFFGSPGTGKTTVAKLFGQIMADLGLLSNGEVVIKNPSDFIGQCLGKSEAKTRTILATTIGKVLIIDEAYMLNGTGGNGDSYKMAVIDTLVAEVQCVPGDDRCILILGYEDKLKDMFHNVNPGLSRRFSIDNPFRFEDFNLQQLKEILDLKLKAEDLDATPEALKVAHEILDRARMRPNFSNAAEVDACLAKAKLNYQTRQSKKPPLEREFDAVFLPKDFDPNFERKDTAMEQCRNQLNGLVDDAIICKLEGYQKIAASMRVLGRDPREEIPTRFVFKGPPGTGKTTTARNMGKIYYNMGFLSTDEVIECSASDLIGQYVGQTGPKTKLQLDKALGKVLFVDEAYRLTEGQYSTEAVNELITSLTTPRYDGKIIVILAGYTKDMNKLMLCRPGLSGIFPEEIIFKNIKPQDCLTLLSRELKGKKIEAPFLEDSSTKHYQQLSKMVKVLSIFPTWSNARDIKTLATEMARDALAFYKQEPGSAPTNPELSLEQALKRTIDMVVMQFERCTSQGLPITSNMDPDKKPPATEPHGLAQAPNGDNGASRCDADIVCSADPARDKPQQVEHTTNARNQTNESSSSVEACHRPRNNGENGQEEIRVKEAHGESERAESSKNVEEDEENRETMGRETKEIEEIEEEGEEEEGEAEKEWEWEAFEEQQKQQDQCEAGYDWIKDSNGPGYTCAGGTHHK